MRNIAIIALSALLLFACSKEQRLSRKIDGTWIHETTNGKALAAGESQEFMFEKDKKGEGTGKFTYTESPESYSIVFTYKIEDDKLKVTVTEENQSTTYIYVLKEVDRKSLTLVSEEGDVEIYKAK